MSPSYDLFNGLSLRTYACDMYCFGIHARSVCVCVCSTRVRYIASVGRAAQQQRIPAEPINDSAVLISFSLIVVQRELCEMCIRKK